MSTLYFKNAIADYRFLKNRHYPDKAALKLVGDHYRCSSVQRNVLLRGVVEDDLCRKRKEKRLALHALRESNLGIDWFNVLITLESYLKGSLLFLSDDGLLRDSSAVHGSYKPGAQTNRAIMLIVEALLVFPPRRVDIFFDSPISHSKKMRDELEQTLTDQRCPFPSALTLLPSADYALKAYPDVVATSDSIVIDSAKAFIDLPRHILERKFDYQAVGLDELAF